MSILTHQRRLPLGLFSDQPWPRLYDRIIQVLRVKDLDFERGEITVRESKGGKDRVTMLPQAVIRPLQEHLRGVQTIHQQDLPHLSPLLRNAPSALRLRHPHRAGVAHGTRTFVRR